MIRGTVQLTPDQQELEMAEQHAISELDKKFILLRLVDFTKNKIQGAICLHAIPYVDTVTGLNKFHFEERGKPLKFVRDNMRGGLFCNMLDCEHNRRFLASMLNWNYWKIEDQTVYEEIKIIADGMAAKARKEKTSVKKVAGEKIMSAAVPVVPVVDEVEPEKEISNNNRGRGRPARRSRMKSPVTI